jgi:cysteine desulfurase
LSEVPVKSVYFDYQGSTPLDPSVFRAMNDAYEFPGNASAEEHAFGWAAARKIEQARALVAESVGALPEEVTFTSGSTEANNIGILGASAAAPELRRRILISAIEHKSVTAAAFAAEKKGFTVEILPVTDAGLVDPTQLSERLGADVAVVSIMAVNNEIGTIQDIEKLGMLTRSAGAFFHVDATQALAAIDVDMSQWRADSLSLSGHKIYGPGGIGALVVAIDAPWRPKPIAYGGGQEGGLRPGTLPVALCVGLGEACRLMLEGAASERQRVADLREFLLKLLQGTVQGLSVTCGSTDRHPGCLHVRLPGVVASDLLLKLQPRVAAATGSACTSGIIGPSHVLLALGMTWEMASECVRFSMGRFSTRTQAIFAANAVAEVLSPRPTGQAHTTTSGAGEYADPAVTTS